MSAARLRCAVALLVGCAAVCAAVSGGVHAAEALSAPSAHANVICQAMFAGASLDEAMAQAGYDVMEAEEVPAWFAEEVIGPERLETCFAAEGMGVVFASILDGSDGSFAWLRSQFEARGWTVVTDDGKGMMSMEKDGGECRWMTVSARSDGERWDAAMRIQRVSRRTDEPSKAGGGS